MPSSAAPKRSIAVKKDAAKADKAQSKPQMNLDMTPEQLRQKKEKKQKKVSALQKKMQDEYKKMQDEYLAGASNGDVAVPSARDMLAVSKKGKQISAEKAQLEKIEADARMRKEVAGMVKKIVLEVVGPAAQDGHTKVAVLSSQLNAGFRWGNKGKDGKYLLSDAEMVLQDEMQMLGYKVEFFLSALVQNFVHMTHLKISWA